MRWYLFLTAYCVAAAQPAAAAKYFVTVEAQEGQARRMEQGLAAVESGKDATAVRLIETGERLEKRGTISVMVLNRGAQPITLGSENLSAKLADGTPVLIVSYDQLAREARNRQKWAMIGAALGAMGNSMNAANAGYASGYGTYSGSSFGSYGGTPYRSYGSGTFTYSGYDAGRAQAASAIAQQQNEAAFSRVMQNGKAAMESLKANIRTTTIDPGQVFGGAITFELPKAYRKPKQPLPISFIVDIAGEQHVFNAIVAAKR